MGTKFLRAAYCLCFCGIYTTWMLSYSYFFHLQLPCGGNSGCTTVALSAAARIAGMPVPLFGLAYYVVLAVTVAQAMVRRPSKSSSIPYVLAMAGAVVSTGFTIYSVAGLHAECTWCIASNIISCVLAVLLAFDRAESGEVAGRDRQFLVAAALVGLLAIALGTKLNLGNARKFPWNPEALAKASLAEMAPTDSVLLNGNEAGPTVVMFVDLECPACQVAFQTVYGVARKDGIRFAIRHRPHRKIHPASYPLAVQAEEAAQQEHGLDFLIAAFKQGIDSQEKGRTLLRSLGARESPQFVRVAKDRIARDRGLARRLGLSETPSVFVVHPGQPPRAVTADSLEDFLRPR